MNEAIEGKVVLITGGSTGLGAETARHLASRGALVAVAARRKDKLDKVVDQIAAVGGQARAYQLDVADKGQFKAVVDAVIADFGRLDVLINNASVWMASSSSSAATSLIAHSICLRAASSLSTGGGAAGDDSVMRPRNTPAAPSRAAAWQAPRALPWPWGMEPCGPARPGLCAPTRG